MSKKSHEEIKNDALVTRYAQLLQWAHQNTKTVRLIVAGAVVLVLAGVGLAYYGTVREKEAQSLLSGAEYSMMIRDYNTALYGDGSVRTGLMEIATSYKRTQAGNIASFYAAVAASQLGEYDQALTFIRSFKAPKGIMGVGSIALHAGILESLGRHDEAAKIYEKAAGWDVNPNTTPKYLVKAANAYWRAGKTKQAVAVADRIIAEYAADPGANTAKMIRARASI